jgi:hypothetical protein
MMIMAISSLYLKEMILLILILDIRKDLKYILRKRIVENLQSTAEGR